MDLTSAIGSLGGDYVNKVTSAMKENASLSTSKSKNSDTTFDAIYDSVAGLLNSTNSYVQKAQQAEIDYALGNMTNTHELGVYQQEANIALQYTVACRPGGCSAPSGTHRAAPACGRRPDLLLRCGQKPSLTAPFLPSPPAARRRRRPPPPFWPNAGRPRFPRGRSCRPRSLPCSVPPSGAGRRG